MAKTYRELLEEKGFRSTTESDSVAGRKKPSYRDLVNSHNASYDAYKANNLAHSSVQYKSQEAQKQADKQEELRIQQEQRQRDAQKHVETVQKLTNQYMPVRPDPIPQVDINKKYGPVSELTKRGATIASSSVSDAPFGFGKIIDLSGDGGSMSVRNGAMEEADRERTEQAERDRKDQAARDGLDARIAKDQRAQLEREHTAALSKLYSGTLSSEEYAAQEALAAVCSRSSWARCSFAILASSPSRAV